MARKGHAPSAPPPPPPPQDESSAEESGSEEEEESPRAPAPQNPPKKPQPHPDAADLSEDESDSDTEEEEKDEDPEPVVQKKAAPAAGKSKTEQERKRHASDPALSGKAKKAKAGTEKAAAHEATSSSKVKKGKAELEKAAEVVPEPKPTPSSKAKKGGAKLENPTAALDPSSSISKPEKTVRQWTKGDEMKILEALAAHVKNEGGLPNTNTLLATVGDRLNRKNCTCRDIYEKVRRLKERYEKAVNTGALPSKEDDLQIYNLSEAVWGDTTKVAVAPTISQNDGAVTKSKKGQANKEKIDGNSKGGAPKVATISAANQHGDTEKGSMRGTKEKTDKDLKSRLSKEATTTANRSKSKKDKDAKNTSKVDKEKMPKDSTTDTQNGGVRGSFDELQKLYSNLAAYVEGIEVQHPCGETLKRAFGSIDDKKAKKLESKIKKLRVKEAKARIRQADIKKKVLNMFIGLVDFV